MVRQIDYVTFPIPYLFVYGTLRRGTDNPASQRLHNSSDYIGHARARGRLYKIAHYPGFVPSDDPDAWVHGDVYLLRSPETTLLELDKYEGCSVYDLPPHEYRRSVLSVLLDSGDWLEAFVYIYTRGVIQEQLLSSGDYLASA